MYESEVWRPEAKHVSWVLVFVQLFSPFSEALPRFPFPSQFWFWLPKDMLTDDSPTSAGLTGARPTTRCTSASSTPAFFRYLVNVGTNSSQESLSYENSGSASPIFRSLSSPASETLLMATSVW
ncbi:hypothetical protein DER45DRAFT_567312 [Fusarium avenaceum]|nr:hypothetical protein DER45DRAFT_567312 [Fusarium avenaceum]